MKLVIDGDQEDYIVHDFSPQHFQSCIYDMKNTSSFVKPQFLFSADVAYCERFLSLVIQILPLISLTDLKGLLHSRDITGYIQNEFVHTLLGDFQSLYSPMCKNIDRM